MTVTSSKLPVPGGAGDASLDAVRAVERKVLWLSTAIIDHANRVRPNATGLKVGGHQASSASMVSIMTALWFRQLMPAGGDAAVPADPAARELRRRQAVAGACPLRRSPRPQVTIAAMGAVMTEALAAADRLADAGIGADVVCVTSPGLLFQALRARQGLDDAPDWILGQAFPASRARPMVTVLDGHPHTLAFLAGLNQVPATHLGVTHFGQSGDLHDIYRYHGLDTDSIVRAALALTDSNTNT